MHYHDLTNDEGNWAITHALLAATTRTHWWREIAWTLRRMFAWFR